MATTTNFGWETPDDTDLVKDGALAMRTLGNAIDSSMVDLKGGTTGQVLSKNSNTDMDFVWVTSDDANAIQNAIVDAKGDLITATAADTPARLAVGSNGDTLVADSAASTGLRWQGNFAAGKNKIINGDFGIWQRGTSFSASGYTSDRWYFSRNNTTTLSRQTFTPGSAPVAGYEGQYFIRLARTSGSGDDYLLQKVEDIRTLAGQTATISFWAKADTSATISQIYLGFNAGSGGANAPGGVGIFGGIAITTSWARYSVTVTVPSMSGATIGTSSYTELVFKFDSTFGNKTVDIWGVQWEAGSVATAFQTATGTLAGELAAVQRYYYETAPLANRIFSVGQAYSTTAAYAFYQNPVTMRGVPAVSFSAAGDFDLFNATGSRLAVTALSGGTPNRDNIRLDITVGSGLVAGNGAVVIDDAAGNAIIKVSAEL